MTLEGSAAKYLYLLAKQKTSCTPHIYECPVPQGKDDFKYIETTLYSTKDYIVTNNHDNKTYNNNNSRNANLRFLHRA